MSYLSSSHTKYGIPPFLWILNHYLGRGLQRLRFNCTLFGIRVAVIEPGAINKEVVTQPI